MARKRYALNKDVNKLLAEFVKAGSGTVENGTRHIRVFDRAGNQITVLTKGSDRARPGCGSSLRSLRNLLRKHMEGAHSHEAR